MLELSQKNYITKFTIIILILRKKSFDTLGYNDLLQDDFGFLSCNKWGKTMSFSPSLEAKEYSCTYI